MKEYEYLGFEREMRLKRVVYYLKPGGVVELPDDFVPGPQFRLVKPKKADPVEVESNDKEKVNENGTTP